MKKHYWNRYLKFIEWIDSQDTLESEYTEVHHIMPKALGGDNSNDNLIRLPYRAHLIAHWLLAKAIPCRETTSAFRCMIAFQDYRRRPFRVTEVHRLLAKKFNTGKLNPQYNSTVFTLKHVSGTVATMTKWEFQQKFPELTRQDITSLLKNRSHLVKGWSLKDTDLSNLPKYKVYNFVHRTGLQRTCTVSELIKEFNLSHNISQLVCGHRRSSQNWRLKETRFSKTVPPEGVRYKVVNQKTGEIVIETIKELSNRLAVPDKTLRRIINCSTKNSKGWVCVSCGLDASFKLL